MKSNEKRPKPWRYFLPAKTGSVILSLIFCGLFLVGVQFLSFMLSNGFFEQHTWNYYQTTAASRITHTKANQIAFDYYSQKERYELLERQQKANQSAGLVNPAIEAEMDKLYITIQEMEDLFRPEKTNFRFIATGDGGKSSISTYEGEEFGLYEAYSFEITDPWTDVTQSLQVDCFVTDPLSVEDEYERDAYILGYFFRLKGAIFLGTVLAGLFMALLLVYLVRYAGTTVDENGRERTRIYGLYQLPFDINLGAVALVVYILYMLWRRFVKSGSSMMNIELSSVHTLFHAMGLAFFGIIAYGFLLYLLVSLHLKIKTKTLFKTLFVVRAGGLLRKRLKLLWQALPDFGAIVGVILLGGAALAGGALIMRQTRGGALWLFLAILGVVVAGALAVVIHKLRVARRRKNAIRRMAEGNLQARISLEGLNVTEREEARDLERMQDAINLSLEERMRSERMKAELITNVSHDIKTPLTSIINYADLLKKETEGLARQEGEGLSHIQEYVSVIDAQSQRLKKLIEDLIEASKASTGNLDAQMQVLSLSELATQAAAEYEDRLKGAGMELIVSMPKEPLYIEADGKYLWRVLDNLLSNALKYSLEGTRVYLDLFEEEGPGAGAPVVVFKLTNVSKYPLHLTDDELLERFVRGDSARHTEGSGLGLSITQSLVDMMNGTFTVHTDGDLFKAELRFMRK